MQLDSVRFASGTRVIHLRTIVIRRPEPKAVELPRPTTPRRAKRTRSPIALAELGRETGARC